MQAEHHSKVLVATKYCKVHRLYGAKRHSITSGECRVMEANEDMNDSTYFLKVDSYYKNIESGTFFIKVSYPKSVSLLVENQQTNQIVSFSFPNVNAGRNDAPNLQKIQDLLLKQQVLIPFESDALDPQMRKRIVMAYPDIGKKPIYHPENVKQVVKTVGFGLGGVFGAINGFFEPKTEKAQLAIQKKVSTLSRESVSASNRQTWSEVKSKASDLNDKVTSYVKPIEDKSSEMVHSIGSSWSTSNNKVVKFLRVFTETASSSINKGFEKGRGHETEEKNENSDFNEFQEKPNKNLTGQEESNIVFKNTDDCP